MNDYLEILKYVSCVSIIAYFIYLTPNKMVINELIIKIINSFDNKNDGFSARKLTSYAFVIFVGYIHLKFVNVKNATEILMIDSAVILLALGLVTAQNLIELKNGSKSRPPSEN